MSNVPKERSAPAHVCNAERCQICERLFHEGDLVYDALVASGRWNTICRTCFQQCGVGLGTGKGQEYAWGSSKKLRG